MTFFMTEAKLLEDLDNLIQELGRDPMAKDIGLHNGTACNSTFSTRFGSLRNALLILRGEGHRIPREYTRDELIEWLRVKADSLNWRMTLVDVQKDALAPPPYEFVLEFGGINEAFIASGLPALKPTKETLREEYRREAFRLGHVPTSRDLNRSRWTYGAGVYRKFFPNFDELARSVGFVPYRRGGVNKARHPLPNTVSISS